MLRKTNWIKICGEEKLCERRINITLAQKICKRTNHFVLLQRELNIVPIPRGSILRKYSSGIYPEIISDEN